MPYNLFFCVQTEKKTGFYKTESALQIILFISFQKIIQQVFRFAKKDCKMKNLVSYQDYPLRNIQYGKQCCLSGIEYEWLFH